MQLQNEIVKKHTPIKSLLIDWLIIFGTYLFIRIFFALFGLHQNIVLLGCCLAILPYLFGALYLQKSHKQCQLWLAALAILIPSVVEKAAIYLFGAYLYNLRPINVVGVMEAIKSNAPYTNFIKNQSAQNLINLSYFNWTYILCSIAISVADGLFCREIDGLFCRSSPDIIVRRRCVLSHKRRGWLQPSPSFRYSRNLALQDELYHPVINNGPAVLVCVDKRLGTGPVNQSRDAG